jgi:hypothetical protein
VPTYVAIASGPFFAACALLVVTGLAKVRQPAATAIAMRSALGLPDRNPIARAVGVVEIGLGLTAAAIAGPFAWGVAALYGGFLVVAVQLLRRAPNAACGCIGDRSGSVGAAHVASSVAAVVVAVTYAVGDGPGIVDVVRDQPVAGLPYVALVACCTGLVTFFLTAPPQEQSWRH